MQTMCVTNQSSLKLNLLKMQELNLQAKHKQYCTINKQYLIVFTRYNVYQKKKYRQFCLNVCQHQVGAIHKSNDWRFSFITFSEINVDFENYRFSCLHSFTLVAHIFILPFTSTLFSVFRLFRMFRSLFDTLCHPYRFG